MKILVWGIGRICNDLIDGDSININNIIGFVETEKSVDIYKEKRVYSFSEIPDFDYLVITTKRCESIFRLLSESHIGMKKACFVFPCMLENDVQRNIEIAKVVMTDNGYQVVRENYGLHDNEWIERDAEKFNELNIRESFEIKKENNYYIYGDKFGTAGTIDSYFWQDLWAAKKIIKNSPKEHFDIGSRIDGFITHILAGGINVNLIDIRPLDVEVENLRFTCADATNLDELIDESIESLSALCSLEHFGLGRYGDPIDPEACFKCFDAIQKKVKIGGNIYISVPIGKEHIEFNAHRVFYATTIIDSFSCCELIEFSTAKNREYTENIDIHSFDSDKSLGGTRFGLFHFCKKGN